LLTHLSVRDLAVVETVSVEFGKGLTVMTGETGAGKSILVDALSLVLGARSSAQAVRNGAARAEVTALFDVSARADVCSMLATFELDDGESELHLRRTVASDGRSRAYVNGRPVPVQSLKEFGALLVDVHGQHEHQTLLDPVAQRDLLDAFGGLSKLVTGVESAYQEHRQLKSEYETLTGTDGDGEARRSLLQYQVEELDELRPEADEFETVRRELGALSRAEAHRSTVGDALLLLDGDGGAESQLGRALTAVTEVAADHPDAAAVAQLLESSAIHMSEARDVLRTLNDSLDGNPERARTLEARLDQLHAIARKHRVTPEQLSDVHAGLRDELSALDSAAGRILELTTQISATLTRYRDAVTKLSAARTKAGKKFSKAVSANMAELGMAGGECVVQVATADDGVVQAGGMDRIEFLVRANPGAEPAPLRKVASGGELSRISLAIQVILAADSGVPTLVFDEVDVGIGGRIAEIVGKRLREVSGDRQVLCITHLAQVACQGNGHILIEKQARRGSSSTSLEQLDVEQRVSEVARMLGGVEITGATLAHAREMLELAAQ
jgi:DNA repair protein RecN (Recombination protein N)